MSWIWQGRQLASASKDGTSLSFTYDSDGIRTSKTVGSTTTKYLLNGTQILAQTTNGKTLSFFYDQQGNRVGMADSSNHIYYYLYNLQGDVIALADGQTGKLAATYTYDAWGKCTVKNATGFTIGTENPFRYRGYYYDSETELYYLQSRYYDAETGRFINADAFASTDVNGVLSANMFAYCENNPVMRSDPTGEIADAVVGGLIGMTTSVIVSCVTGNSLDKIILDGVAGFITGAISNNTINLAINAALSLYNGIEAGIKCKNILAGVAVFSLSFGGSLVSGKNVSKMIDGGISKLSQYVTDATFGLGANMIAPNVAADLERNAKKKVKSTDSGRTSYSKRKYNEGCHYGFQRGLSWGAPR